MSSVQQLSTSSIANSLLDEEDLSYEERSKLLVKLAVRIDRDDILLGLPVLRDNPRLIELAAQQLASINEITILGKKRKNSTLLNQPAPKIARLTVVTRDQDAERQTVPALPSSPHVAPRPLVPSPHIETQPLALSPQTPKQLLAPPSHAPLQNVQQTPIQNTKDVAHKANTGPPNKSTSLDGDVESLIQNTSDVGQEAVDEAPRDPPPVEHAEDHMPSSSQQSSIPSPASPQMPDSQNSTTTLRDEVTGSSKVYDVIADEAESAPKFNYQSRTMEVKFNAANIHNDDQFFHALEEICAEMQSMADENDQINLSIESAQQADQSVTMPFGNRDSINAEAVLYKVAGIIQSNKEFCTNGILRFTARVVHMPSGSGPGETTLKNLEYLKFTSIVTSKCKNRHHAGFENEPTISDGKYRKLKKPNNFCLPYSLVIAEYYLTMERATTEVEKKRATGEFKQECKQISKKFAKKVDELMSKAGVDLRNKKAVYTDIVKFDNVCDFAIVVYDIKKNNKKTIVYDSRDEKPLAEVAFIALKNNHYDFMKSRQSFFKKATLCDICGKNISYQINHRCITECPKCYGKCDAVSLKDVPPTIPCGRCNMLFKTQQCYEMHTQTQGSEEAPRCHILHKCLDCNLIHKIDKTVPHKCDKIFCTLCKTSTNPEHDCYIIRETGSADSDVRTKMPNSLITYYDCETMLEKDKNGAMKHVVCMISCETLCDVCREDETEYCPDCGKRSRMFDNLETDSNPVADFLEYVHAKCAAGRDGKKKTDRTKTMYILGHNAGRFDTIFILKEIVRTNKWNVTTLLTRGKKILKLEVEHDITKRKLIFLDTYAFIATPLADMPKAFNVPEAKGEFPYKLISRENFGEVYNTLPPLSVFEPDLRTEKRRASLMKWYQEEKSRMIAKDEKYIINDKLREYCAQDTRVLRRCFEKFCKEMRTFGADPILSGCITIAMVAMTIYLRMHIPLKTIARIPRRGYRFRDNQSRMAIRYLSAIELQENIVMMHAGRGPEKKILNAGVDGYHEHGGTKTIYQVHGCLYHGCEKCVGTVTRYKFRDGLSPTDRYMRTIERTKRLRKKGYKVIEIYEHDVKRFFANNKALMKRVDALPWMRIEKLDLDEVLKGGMTLPVAAYYCCEEDEEIKYLDFHSMYPGVQAFSEYPKGAPVVLLPPNIPPIEQLFGVVKLKILAPKKLHVPPLAFNCNGRLVGALCRKCAEEMIKESCTHSRDERAFVGCWTTVEIMLALQKGYEVIKIYEAWHYNERIRYTKPLFPGGPSIAGIFSSYILPFFKMKTQASGLPRADMSLKEIDKLCADFYKATGLMLDRNELIRNDVLRMTCKLILNALWGKFAQRPINEHTYLVNNLKDFVKLFNAPGVTVKNTELVSDETMMVTTEIADEECREAKFSNKVIAAFVTAYGRCQLYKAVDKLGQRILYMDTDSVIFVQKKGEEILKVGDQLGELGDELEGYGKGSFIQNFGSCGPKNYGYTVVTPQEEGPPKLKFVRKCKGFSLNYSTAQSTTLQRLKDLVDNVRSEDVIEQKNQFVRNKYFEIFSKDISKKMHCTFSNKRIPLNDGSYNSVPYGTVVEYYDVPNQLPEDYST